MIITCSPGSVFSWNYFLEGSGHQAIWQKNWTSEQGSILIDGEYFTIKKHGVTSGTWTMESDTQVLFTGVKESVFKRSFQIEGSEKVFGLGAVSAFGRSFYLELDGDVVAMISPKHAFTRKAEIEILDSSVEFPAVVFAFWLAILTWRRKRRKG